MRMPRTPQAYEALDAYRDAPRRERLRVKVRWLTSPIAAVEREVPRSGRILDVGCGDGLVSLYLAVCAQDRDIVGVDVDAHKVELARQAVPYLGDRAGSVELHAVEPGVLPDGPFDVVIIDDGRHPLGAESRRSVIDACTDRLAPGGTILVERTGAAPWWETWIAGVSSTAGRGWWSRRGRRGSRGRRG